MLTRLNDGYAGDKLSGKSLLIEKASLNAMTQKAILATLEKNHFSKGKIKIVLSFHSFMRYLAVIYFEVAGKENVDKSLELVKRMAEEHGTKNVIVASITGFTARKAFEVFKDMDVTLTVVGTERNRFSTDLQRKLEEEGHHVCFSREVSYLYPDLVKLAFRRFSEGVKVAVEVGMIAAQKRFVSTEEDVICVGKWDTALIIKPATSDNFSELKVRELICMPR